MNGAVEEFKVRPPKALTFDDSLVILGKLLSDPGCDIMLGQKITMRDSISMKQFTHPCRAFGCKHVQCFDFEVYLHVNKAKLSSEYCCPICQQISNPSKIYVDAVFLCLLQVVPDDSTVNLMKDGTFEVLLATTSRMDIEVIDVDCDEEAEFEVSVLKSSGPIVGSVAELSFVVPLTAAKSKKNHTTLKELAEASLDDVLYLINVDNAWGVNTIPDISELLQIHIKKKRPYACTTIDGLLYCLRQVDGMGEVRAGRIVKHLFGVLQKKLTGFLEHIRSRAIVSAKNVSLSSPIVVECLKKNGKLRLIAPANAPTQQTSGVQQQNDQIGADQNEQNDRSNSDREGTANSHSSGSTEKNNTNNNNRSAAKTRANSIISVDSSVCEESHHSINTPSSTHSYTTTDSFAASTTSSSAKPDQRPPRSHHSAAFSANVTTAIATNRESTQVSGQPSAAAHRAKGSSAICGEGIADVAGLPKLTRLGRNNTSSGTILLENCLAPEVAANNSAYTLHQVTVTDLCESGGSDVEANARARELVVLAASPKQRTSRSRVTSPTASVRSATSNSAISAESVADAASPSFRRSKRSRTAEEPASPLAEYSPRSRDIVDVDEAQDAISVSSASAIVPVTSPSRSKRARREAQRQEERSRDDANGSVVSEMTRSGSSAASSVVGLPTAAAATSANTEAQLVEARASTVTPVIANERNGEILPPTIPAVVPQNIASPQARRRQDAPNVAASPAGTHIRFQGSPDNGNIAVSAAASQARNNSNVSVSSRPNGAPVDVKPFVALNRAANGVSQHHSISATALSVPSFPSQQQQARSPSARPSQAPVIVIPPRSQSASSVTNVAARTVPPDSFAGPSRQVSIGSAVSSPPAQLVSPALAQEIRAAAKSRDYAPEDSLQKKTPYLIVRQGVQRPAYCFGLVDKRDRDNMPFMMSATVHAEMENRPAQGKVFYPRGVAVPGQQNAASQQPPEAWPKEEMRSNQLHTTTEPKWASNSGTWRHDQHQSQHPNNLAHGQWPAARSPDRRARSRSRERRQGSRSNEADSDAARRAHNTYYNNSDSGARDSRDSRGSRDGSRRRHRSNSRERGHHQSGRDSRSHDRSQGLGYAHQADQADRTAFPPHYGNERGHFIEKEHVVGRRSEMASASDNSSHHQPPPSQDYRAQDSNRDTFRDRRVESTRKNRFDDRDQVPFFSAPSFSQEPSAPLHPAPGPAVEPALTVRPPPPAQIGSRGYNQAPTEVPNFPGYNANRSVGMVRQSTHPPPAPSTLARAGATVSGAPVAVASAPQATPVVPPVVLTAVPSQMPPAPTPAATPAATAAAPSVLAAGRISAWRPPEPKLPPPKTSSTAGSSSDSSAKLAASQAKNSTATVGASNTTGAVPTHATPGKATKGIVRVYEGKVVSTSVPPSSANNSTATAAVTASTNNSTAPVEIVRVYEGKVVPMPVPARSVTSTTAGATASTAAAGIVRMYEGKVVPMPTSSGTTNNNSSATASTAAAAAMAKKKAQNNAKLLDAPPTQVGAEHVSVSSLEQHKPNSFHYNNSNDRRFQPNTGIGMSTASTGYHAATGSINNHQSANYHHNNGNNNHTSNTTNARTGGESFTSLIVQNFSKAQE